MGQVGRKAELRQKSGYYASHIFGKTKYFGRVGEVPYEDALRRFQEYLVSRELADIKGVTPADSMSVDELADLFLKWVLANRGEKAHRERARHIGRFREMCGRLPVLSIRDVHLEDFLDKLRQAGHAQDYILKHSISVRAMFNKGVKRGWLPPGFSPFDSVEPIKQTLRPLNEYELLTGAEVQALFAAADLDPHQQMGDILRLYHATGARTAELVTARVRGAGCDHLGCPRTVGAGSDRGP